MSVNGVTSNSYESSSYIKKNSASSSNEKKEVASDSQTAVVYEKNTEKIKKTTYKQDLATLEQLKADAERRTKQLRDLVHKMMLSQGKVWNESEMYSYLQSDDLTVDEETVKQAQADIAEDGYWGVNQTSDRLVSFAKALTGGDPSKVDDMIAAIKKGFSEAEKAWGGELPDICKKTLEATMEKLEQWRSEATGESKA